MVIGPAEAVMYAFIFLSLYFQVFLLITFLESRGRVKQEEAHTEPALWPSVTIAVPCFNESKTVRSTVESLLALDYPTDRLHITIVDDGSTDTTWEEIQLFKDNPQVRLYQKENGGKYTALNFALAHSTSEYFGCLDADSFVDSNALKVLIQYFIHDPETMAVTPAIKIFKPDSWIRKIQNVEYVLSIFIRKSLGLLNAIHVTPGPFSIFRRSVFEQLGPYRHAYHTEDMEMAMRMHYHHMKIVNAHQAYVYTVGPKTLRALLKQRLRWVYGFLKNAADYRRMFFKPSYGHISMFTLPAAVVSIFAALYYVGFALSTLVEVIGTRVERLETVGMGSVRWPTFDWFYLNTSAQIFLVAAILTVTLLLVYLGSRLAKEKSMFPEGTVYYLFLYGFIAPIWLFQAVSKVLLRHEIRWR